MPSHASRIHHNQETRSVAPHPTARKVGRGRTFHFVDNRPDTVARIVQDLPEGDRIARLHEISNNGPQSKKIAQLQAMATAQGLDLPLRPDPSYRATPARPREKEPVNSPSQVNRQRVDATANKVQAANPPIQRYVETEDGVKISTNTVFAVKGEGRSSELYVDEDVKLPALQHVNLAPGGEGLMVNEKRLIKVNAEFEEEDEMAAMFCGKFSEMITGIGETEENETAGPGRSLYVKDLFALEGDYDGAWRNHFAPVLVADDTDRGTLETAVGIDLIWYGIYGKERGQSFRYKTIVADVMLQLSRSRIEPRQAEEILGYLKGYVAKGVPPEGSVPMDVGREILDIEKRLQSAAVLGDKQARPTELPSVKEKREKAEAAVREKAQDQLVLDIREGTDGWQDRVQQSHKFTLKLKIVQALESSGLEGEERGRLEAARKMVAQPQSLGSGPVEEARPWPSLLQIIGGVATLAVLGGLWYWRFHR